MPKEKPLQENSIRGDDTLKIAETGYNGKIPVKDFMALEKELFGMTHGSVSLTIAIRGGQLQYSRINKEYTMRGDNE